jgi:hypothetical protein
MTFKCLAVALAGLLALLILAAADAADPQLLVQTKTIALDPLADQHRGGMKWSHGAFLFQSGGAGLAPTFYTLDREGRLVSSVTASIPDAGYVSVGGCDRRGDNSIVFIGQARSAYGQPAPFIALISTDGRTERVISTAPYWPYMLTVAPDGTFWTLGFEMVNDKVSAPELDPNAGVLRHFDRLGKLLGSTGPQSHFVKDSASEFRLTSGFIAATRTRIGWYGQGPGTGGQYVEIDLNSMTMHSYPGLSELPESSRLVCFSLTESGSTFLSLYDNAAQRSTTFMFDRAALKWLLIKANERPAPYLIGVDGEQLVFRDWSSKAFFFSLSH